MAALHLQAESAYEYPVPTYALIAAVLQATEA